MIRARRLQPRSFVPILLTIPWLVGMAWWGIADSEPSSAEFLPGEFYSVEVHQGRAVVDLTFESDARYLLVVSSLAPAETLQTIELTSEPIADAQLLPIQPVPPFQPRKRRNETSPGFNGEPAIRLLGAPGTCPSMLSAPLGPEFPTADGDTDTDVAADAAQRVRDFYLHVTDGSLEDPRQYACVSARVIAAGRQVRVYWDEQAILSAREQETADEIARLLEEEIIPGFRESLGQIRDIDGNGQFSVLLTPWLDRLQGGRTSLGGFVRGSDFRLNLDAPFSNHCDMMYLNANLRPGPHLKVLLAHEFAHAVCFSERSPTLGRSHCLPNEEDWLNEAIAHVAESRHGGHWSNLDYRISRFLNAPHRSPLVVSDYYQAGLWRDHGCRGATYLFLQWCVDQHGDELLKRLVQAPFRGVQNLEWATGTSFEELYRHWSLALLGTNLPIADCMSGANAESSQSRSTAGPFVPGRGYSSLNLCGPLSKYGLAGPRRLEWNVDDGGRQIELPGTSMAFFELHSSTGDGSRRIRIQGGMETALQVTILKCPQEWPRAEMVVRRLAISDAATVASDHSEARLLEVQITGAAANGLTLDMIACEQDSRGERQKSACFTAGDLSRLGDAAVVPDDSGSEATIRLVLPIRGEWADEAMILKFLATDVQGRRVVGWQKVPACDRGIVTASRMHTR